MTYRRNDKGRQLSSALAQKAIHGNIRTGSGSDWVVCRAKSLVGSFMFCWAFLIDADPVANASGSDTVTRVSFIFFCAKPLNRKILFGGGSLPGLPLHRIDNHEYRNKTRRQLS